jgi:hypothetical protein
MGRINLQGYMIEVDADQLQRAIEGLHRCSARLAQSVPVKQTDKGAVVSQLDRRRGFANKLLNRGHACERP